jgi:hypothetical protein
MFEATKGVIKSVHRGRTYNTIVKIKRAKGKKTHLLNITQNTKDRKTLTSLTTGLNCGSTEGGTGPAPHVTTVV